MLSAEDFLKNDRQWLKNTQKSSINKNQVQYGFYVHSKEDCLYKDGCIEVKPIGLGKIASLRDKFELIMGGIWIKGKGAQGFILNPMFKYVIEKMMLFEFVRGDHRQTQKEEFIESLSNFKEEQEEEEKKIVLKDYVDQVLKNIESQTYSNQIFGGKECSKTEKLLSCTKKCQQLFQRRLKQYLALQRQVRDDAQQNNQVERIKCDNLDRVDLMRQDQQNKKVQLFCKKHKYFFNTCYTKQKTITLDKLFHEQIVCHSIADQINLQSLCEMELNTRVQLVKDLCLIMKKYQKKVSRSHFKQYYYLLNPSNVLFSQSSLRPKLKFEPLILESLGLRKRPATIQNLITFFPTPRDFDYFQAPIQLKQQTQVKLDDSFYGCLQLCSLNHNVRQKEERVIYEQKKDLSQIHRQMAVWRFLLTSHYLLQGKAFGKNQSSDNLEVIQKDFKHKLQQKREQLRKDQSKLSEFLGFKNKKKQKKEFNLAFQELLDYLSLEDTQILEEYKYEKIKIYRTARRKMLRELAVRFTSELIFTKILNVKKYMCMMCIFANQIVDQYKCFLQSELKRQGSRRDVMEMVSKQIKTLRNDQPYYKYFLTCYDHIAGYKERNPEEDNQAHYLMLNRKGQHHFSVLCELKNEIDQIVEENRKLNDLQRSMTEGDNDQNMRQKYRNKVKQMKQNYKFLLINKKCIDLVLSEMMEPENFHKLPNKEKNTEKTFNLITKKTIVLILALFKCRQRNLFSYESLILPFLCQQSFEKRKYVKVLSFKELNEEEKNLSMVLELILINTERQKRIGEKYPSIADTNWVFLLDIFNVK